jgi:uncharacterized protein YbbC (DUF1343 family)
MGLFDKIFGRKVKDILHPTTVNKQPEHAVIIRFNYGIEGVEALHSLEDKLEKIIVNKKAGEYDGHEIATDYSDGILYMYGPNAEVLFKAIKPTLEQTSFMKGAIVKLRFGPPVDGVKEIEFEL